jgi:ABC-type multidrug transport system fused ATPase/permease subunit
VLDRGRIAECGNHDQLVARQGRYFEMLQVQLHAARDYAA